MTGSDGERVVRSVDAVPPGASVVTIGQFDGVHRGHRTLLERARTTAADAGCRSVAVTFDRHPAEVVRPGSQPPALQPLDRKITALLDEGIDLVVVLPFTPAFSQLSPEAFVERVLAGPLQARTVIVGTNFRFGHRAAGDVRTLTELGEQHGFEVVAADLLELDGTTVSSTAVRERLGRGDVAWAARALGRPYTLTGPVVRGEGRGRSIGVPTANVAVDQRLQLPADGVYAGRCRVLGEQEPSDCVVNIGTRPTFGGEHTTVEAHLLDTERNLYGVHVEVAFVARIRDERRFPGPDALVEQIHRDIATARERLGEVPT